MPDPLTPDDLRVFSDWLKSGCPRDEYPGDEFCDRVGVWMEQKGLELEKTLAIVSKTRQMGSQAVLDASARITEQFWGPTEAERNARRETLAAASGLPPTQIEGAIQAQERRILGLPWRVDL